MWVDEFAFERAAVEARTIQEQTGFLPALDDPRLKVREILFWFPLEGDGPIDGLLRMQQPGDHATRAVVAATLYSLIGDNPSGDGYDTLAWALQRLVASVAVKDLTHPALLRWELHLAATGNSLERALEVWRRLEDVEPTAEIRALVANAVFLLVHPSRPALDFFTPSAFDPLIHSPGWEWQRVSDLFTYVLATTVEKRGNLSWNEPATFPPSALDALIDIEVLLKRVQNATKSLTPTQRAVQTWCWFAQGSAAQDSGKLNEAGRSYSALATYSADGGHVLSGSSAAATCFALACNWSGATEAARKWIGDAPKDAPGAPSPCGSALQAE